MPRRTPAPSGRRGSQAQARAASRPAASTLRLWFQPLPAARPAARAAKAEALPPPAGVRRPRRRCPRDTRQRSAPAKRVASRGGEREEKEAASRRSRFWAGEGGWTWKGGGASEENPDWQARPETPAGSARSLRTRQAALRRDPRKPGAPALPSPETPRVLIGPRRTTPCYPLRAAGPGLQSPPASPPPRPPGDPALPLPHWAKERIASWHAFHFRNRS